MLQYFTSCNSCTSIHIEYLFYQASDLATPHLLRYCLELSTLDLPEKICLILCEKGQRTSYYDIQYNTAGPHVRSKPIVGHLPREVWIHIVRSAAIVVEVLRLTHT